ncbi:MAG: B12-binding domain-containing radical SAM protein [Candidatus Aenigmarchaeota archaeon]|nr:B12-binding domain-containing radical SAM protein [Candidatus Aenigmarchaeota archaeon]
MAKYVLISDTTLTRYYHNISLLDFLPSAPTTVPRKVYKFLQGGKPRAINGRAAEAPYGLRKIEAALLKDHSPDEVVVAHENHLESFIKGDTEVIAVHTMDPLGIGPLTMSFAVLMGCFKTHVRQDFEELIARINRARKGLKAKLLVGGPGVWDFTMLPEELERLGIDYAFYGEADDIAGQIFADIASGSAKADGKFFKGFVFYDNTFSKNYVERDRFITRARYGKQAPNLEEIPLIRNPSMKSLVEVMRGCGVGCDFCEVTLRPRRFYTNEMIRKEIEVNIAGGSDHAWVHSDEIFVYKSVGRLEPNPDALKELFSAIMSVPGVRRANPTHGRISIPAGYPELIKDLSGILKSGPDNWIGIQVGIETGSEKLAAKHMPNKTLPLKIGPDGSWHDIVINGTSTFNRNYWRPAFTVQVGQPDETPEDNWDTVALINRLSNSSVDGRPLEFTVTPMQNVALGMLKGQKDFRAEDILHASQVAVYYAAYCHLFKMVDRSMKSATPGNAIKKELMHRGFKFGSGLMLRLLEKMCRNKGLDPEDVKRHGLESGLAVRS